MRNRRNEDINEVLKSIYISYRDKVTDHEGDSEELPNAFYEEALASVKRINPRISGKIRQRIGRLKGSLAALSRRIIPPAEQTL